MPGLPSLLRSGSGGLREAVRASFGFPAAVAMVVAVGVGIGLPYLDDLLEVQLPLLAFATADGARSLLETVASATVSVAGLSFSVTLVAFTLTAQQLSPRVLRSFRRDRMSQATLACLLGTFVYCVVLLVRLDRAGAGTEVPNLSLTLAVVLALASFGLFSAFITHIVGMLQPAAIIAGIADDARALIAQRFPSGVGAAIEGDPLVGRGPGRLVLARKEGYLTRLRGEVVLEAAGAADAIVRQHLPLGDYVVPGDPLAETWSAQDGEGLDAKVRDAFVVGKQRTPVQDLAFAVRQLADIALKGVSPGINDPTTAENAMEAMTAVIVRIAGAEPVPLVRADAAGVPRFVACAPSLDDLVRLGFDQVRVFAADDPVVSAKLLALLARMERAAATSLEARRQADLVLEAARAS